MKRWLLGPELYWGVLCLLALIAGRLNVPPTDAGSEWLEKIGAWGLPLLAVPLSFVLVFALLPDQGFSRWALWGRLWLATALGAGLALTILSAHIDYQSSRNSGVMAVWMLGLLLASVVFIACSLVLALWFWLAGSSGAEATGAAVQAASASAGAAASGAASAPASPSAAGPWPWGWQDMLLFAGGFVVWLLLVFFLIGAAGPPVGLAFAAVSALVWFAWRWWR